MYKRQEEAIAAAILQRLMVQRDQLGEQETRARAMIDTLRGRIAELARDGERESGLNRDAGETIARLDWEVEQLVRAHDGHDDRLAEAADVAREASAALTDREQLLSQATEDAARLAARHQSVQRMLADSRAGLAKAEAESGRAREAVTLAETALAAAAEAFAGAEDSQEAAAALAEAAEEALLSAEDARAEVQGRESEARAVRSEAEGEAAALRAEVAALAKLVEREAQAGHQVLDRPVSYTHLDVYKRQLTPHKDFRPEADPVSSRS